MNSQAWYVCLDKYTLHNGSGMTNGHHIFSGSKWKKRKIMPINLYSRSCCLLVEVEQKFLMVKFYSRSSLVLEM